MKRDLFLPFANLALAACSSTSNFDRGSGTGSAIAVYRSEPQAPIEIAKLGAAWFDAVKNARCYHKINATPEEIDAHMRGRDQTSLSRATSPTQTGAVDR